MYYMEEFAKRLKEILNEKNISQKAFSKKINMSQSIINGYCTGTRIPSLDAFKKICIELNVEANYLLGLED